MAKNALHKLADALYEDALAHGWYDDGEGGIKERNFPEIVALCHSELSEALEEHRKGYDPAYIYYREDGKPEGIGMEMADTIIRCLDWFASEGLDPLEFINEKAAFNKTRPYKHGGKVC